MGSYYLLLFSNLFHLAYCATSKYTQIRQLPNPKRWAGHSQPLPQLSRHFLFMPQGFKFKTLSPQIHFPLLISISHVIKQEHHSSPKMLSSGSLAIFYYSSSWPSLDLNVQSLTHQVVSSLFTVLLPSASFFRLPQLVS